MLRAVLRLRRFGVAGVPNHRAGSRQMRPGCAPNGGGGGRLAGPALRNEKGNTASAMRYRHYDYGNRERRRGGGGLSRAVNIGAVLAALALFVLPWAVDATGLALQWVRAPAGDCRILRVIDGDTVQLWCRDGAGSARLTGFDAPELFSPRCPSEYLAAQKAKWTLRGLVLGAKRLEFHRMGRDRYDRALVAVVIDGEPLARRMIAAGVARPYAGGHRGGWCGRTDEPRADPPSAG